MVLFSIQQTFEEKLKRINRLKYKNLDMKLTKLIQIQNIIPGEHHSFYPRIINNTNITFIVSPCILIH